MILQHLTEWIMIQLTKLVWSIIQLMQLRYTRHSCICCKRQMLIWLIMYLKTIKVMRMWSKREETLLHLTVIGLFIENTWQTKNRDSIILECLLIRQLAKKLIKKKKECNNHQHYPKGQWVLKNSVSL